MKKKVFIVAKYFIWKNKKNHIGLTNKKLQKLLYYAQAWSLVRRNKKLFQEDIEAWIHGPAIPSVYSEFKKFGFKEIQVDVDEDEFSDLSESEKKILDSVWQVYGKYDADYLELLSHNEEPWIKARNGAPPYNASNSVIDTNVMKDFYGRQIRKAA